ncbi:hypothetical protein DFR41_104217 [Pseudacidovorax intermedius]|uniref:Phage portal protein n=1 Tax=Pseudacidovorax intermedius TaxID=433924 RepID=A0A370FIB8_9BURK|nr:hypothetical protein [Pseudacidovorax intermedius]RDI25161.1 hypothetical protein DFR41_104217 [Pseudacidovorax intermedius]
MNTAPTGAPRGLLGALPALWSRLFQRSPAAAPRALAEAQPSKPMGEAFADFNPGASRPPNEVGARVPSDLAMERLYRTMWIDTERRALIRSIREMDVLDGRVKRIHGRVARDCIRGGLVFQAAERSSSQTLKREWEAFRGRLQLDVGEKLKSDARGFVMEGNLPLQLVLDDASPRRVVSAIRMPSDTIQPITDMNGRFSDPARAYEQRDVMTGEVLARFAAWQLMMARLDPDNYDDQGSLGRPFLDACATTWRKLVMTEEDLVIRRRVRAPLRLAHVLEGADDAVIAKYRQDVEGEQGQITTDFYLNRKGSVTAIQGDAKLNEIEDVVHLLDTFFAGSPAPKALFGYTNGLSRDILEDLKRDYYDEVDGVQDSLAQAYNLAFRIHLLFRGMDPGADEFTIRFAERRTETPNQVADLALKWLALGLPRDLIYADMGLDPAFVRSKAEEEAQRTDPYPVPPGGTGAPPTPSRVSITPGNARKGESGTAVSQPGSNGGAGRA